jgi:hypothetical protein
MKSPWVSDRVIWVTKECNHHRIFPEIFVVQVPRHIPVMVGRGPIVLPNHILYIQLWNKEVLQHIEVHVTRNGSLGGRRMVRKLAFCWSNENIHLLTVPHMFDNLVWILLSPDNWTMAILLP